MGIPVLADRQKLQQLCANTGCSQEDLPQMMDDQDDREKVNEICASSVTWWYMNGSL